jgi:hypothetical protein
MGYGTTISIGKTTRPHGCKMDSLAAHLFGVMFCLGLVFFSFLLRQIPQKRRGISGGYCLMMSSDSGSCGFFEDILYILI